jgi:dTDP-4-dehydrorhamnose reductase
MTRYAVIGASGQVGGYLYRAVLDSGAGVAGTYGSHPAEGLRALDIRDGGAVEALLAEERPSAVFLPASLTNVDYCEAHPAEGYEVNVAGVRNVVAAANAVGARLVYFSSDYVFDGRSGPYAEDAPANPLCEYGRQKLAAEHYVALHARSYLIIRTTVVYGWERQGKNFVQRLVASLSAGRTVAVPADQVGSPTYAPDLAAAALALARSDARGVAHVVGSERASRYEFACEAAGVFGLDPGLIRPVSTAELGQAAPRPLNAGMTVGREVERITGRLLDYRRGLEMMAAEARRGAAPPASEGGGAASGA